MLNEKQLSLCKDSRWDFSDLTALFPQLHAQAKPRAVAHGGPRRDRPSDHEQERRQRGGAATCRLRDRAVCIPTCASMGGRRTPGQTC